jgi:hypothetical protein
MTSRAQTREGSWNRCHKALVYMATKALGVRPARSYLVLSQQWAVAPIRGCEAPGLGYLVEC